jgi:hypothetical protein
VQTPSIPDEPGAANAEGTPDPFADLADVPLADHVGRFEAVYDTLQARLAGESDADD